MAGRIQLNNIIHNFSHVLSDEPTDSGYCNIKVEGKEGWEVHEFEVVAPASYAKILAAYQAGDTVYLRDA